VADEERTVREIVRERTGAEPHALRFRQDDEGLVALLTIEVPGDQTLDVAHRAATAVERAIRDAAPAIAAVIVHTEPAGSPSGTRDQG
jgi:divalent metal cation (Fe/Co/Zn/Cd) transporter